MAIALPSYLIHWHVQLLGEVEEIAHLPSNGGTDVDRELIRRRHGNKFRMMPAGPWAALASGTAQGVIRPPISFDFQNSFNVTRRGSGLRYVLCRQTAA